MDEKKRQNRYVLSISYNSDVQAKGDTVSRVTGV